MRAILKSLRALDADYTTFSAKEIVRDRAVCYKGRDSQEPCNAIQCCFFVTNRAREYMKGSSTTRDASSSARKSVLLVVENLPVPYDRRVWQEALALKAANYQVSVISPATARHPRLAEQLEGQQVNRDD